MSIPRIMIVEDEAIVAEDIKKSLENMGYEVTAILKTGEAAVEKAEQDRPDAILMDIRLKGQMDGIEAARKISDRFNIPSIFMSGYAREDIKGRLGIAEPFEYVIKPVENIDLKNVIESVLLGKNLDR